MLQGIPSLIGAKFSATYTVTDSDAIAFLSATAITDSTISRAVDTLVIAAKANGWWTLCNAIYPFVGGTATTNKYNLKDARDTDEAFRLTFTGSWTHSSNGALPDGSTAYADTHLTPANSLTYNNTHMSFYSRTNIADTGADWGVQGNSSQRFRMVLQLRYATDVNYHDHYSAIGASEMGITGVTDSRGWFLSSRTSSSLLTGYRNGSSIGTNTNVDGSDGLANRSMKLSTLDADGVLGNYSSRQCAFATVGASINSTIAAAMYTDIQAFQTTLGRQV